nr:fimbria/pilus outer membrane usher protein [Jiella mangrovi]
MSAALLLSAAGLADATGLDMSVLDTPGPAAPAAGTLAPVDLQLEVFVNGAPTGLVAEVHEEPDGTLTMDRDQLGNVGIRPEPSAAMADGRIALARLAGVVVDFDPSAQTLSFTAPDSARLPKQLSGRAARIDPLDAGDPRNAVVSSPGAVLNYTLNANTTYGFDNHEFVYDGISGSFDGRAFGALGVAEQSYLLARGELRRLNSSWSYSDPQSLRRYVAGDLITGGLSWTRPTRLLGFQVQRNFGLRSGLVTIPIPSVAGTAAVPSTAEVFVDNSRRFSQKVDAGPFEIDDLPIITGAGTARLVVRDENGNETVTESDYFVSDRLLRAGLVDYSAEIGVPRTGFGTDYDRYDADPYGSASLRWGASDRLTLEGHGEFGADLAEAGIGLSAPLGAWGAGSVAGAASSSALGTGFLLDASAETQLGHFKLRGHVQRSFGDFADIAAVSACDCGDDDHDDHDDGLDFSGGVARAIDQVTLSFPAAKGSVSLSYTAVTESDGESGKIASLSFGRPLFGGSFTATASADLQDGGLSAFTSFSMPIGGGTTASSTAYGSDPASGVSIALSHPGKDEVGNVAWQIQAQTGDTTRANASAGVRTGIGEMRGQVRQSGSATWANASVSGAVAVLDDSVFLADPIDDAFAVVDAGGPGVTVLRENRPVGITGANGKLLVTDLRSYERNRLGIDPTGMPLDADVERTRATIIPADRSGGVVTFGRQAAGGAALVSFRDGAGAFLPVGTTGSVSESGDDEPFVVGYDGQAYVKGLTSENLVVLHLPDETTCHATFGYRPADGDQVVISDIPCLAQ